VTHQSRIRDRRVVARELMVLRFERPEGFDYAAGQFCFMTVPDIGFRDDEGLRKPFSIASSPQEKDLLFSVRITESAFKSTLREMPIGSSVNLDNAVGLFTLPQETAVPLAFLAGGIGVAPFRSMLRYAADAPTEHQITLYYSSRAPEEALFLDEFEEIARRRPHTRIVATVTRPDAPAAGWKGLTGRLSPDMIKQGCRDWTAALYYLSGPPAMVEGLKNMLEEMGIVRDRVKREIWTGY
jgi:ferredoxin-NADP reductase